MQIATFVAAMVAINTGGYLWVIGKAQSGIDVANTIPVLAILNIASTYLSFIVFAAATNVLVRANLINQAGNQNA